jgi:hypothetical protein
MQSQVAERDNRSQTSNTEPVRGNGGVSLDVFAGTAGVFELRQGFTASRVGASAGFDEFEALLARTLELVSVDSASLESGWAWSRPGNEFAILEQKGQTELGFEAFNGSPIGTQNAKWVSYLDAFIVESNSWLDEEQPNANGEKANDYQEARNAMPLTGKGHRTQSNESYESGSDNCVSSNAGANDLHSAYYPSETNGSHLKCEETK